MMPEIIMWTALAVLASSGILYAFAGLTELHARPKWSRHWILERVFTATDWGLPSSIVLSALALLTWPFA